MPCRVSFRDQLFNGWSCRCGKRFRSYSAEAFHRHNFPALCRPKRVRKGGGTRTGRLGPHSGHIVEVEK